MGVPSHRANACLFCADWLVPPPPRDSLTCCETGLRCPWDQNVPWLRADRWLGCRGLRSRPMVGRWGSGPGSLLVPRLPRSRSGVCGIPDPGAHQLSTFGHGASFAKEGGGFRGLISGVFFLAICHFSTPPLFETAQLRPLGIVEMATYLIRRGPTHVPHSAYMSMCSTSQLLLPR